MQLRSTIAIVLGCCYFGNLKAQQVPEEDKPIELNFLSNYYYQNGTHSAVGGGEGSEKLSNITESIVINIPVKRNFIVGVSGGLELFSSASQNANGTTGTGGGEGDRDDDDDDEYYSSASPKGQSRSVIGLADLSLTKINEIRNMEYGGGAGVYKDENATSLSMAAFFSKSTPDDNNTFALKANYYHDIWNLKDPGTIINGTDHLGNGIRQTYSVATSYARVVNKRLTMALLADFVYQKGLLSTPYHMVYFADQTTPALERLPSTRLKFPVAVKLNYHATDFMIFQAYYRFYYDTWNIRAHTAQLEIPLKVTPWLRVYPFYRFHQQSSSDHFAPYGTFESNAPYYTADYDLSALTTHKMGLGISITPVNGFFRTKSEGHPGRSFLFKSIDLRYAYYQRNDGLTGHMVTGGLSFTLSRSEK